MIPANMELQGQPYYWAQYPDSTGEGGLSPISVVLGLFLVGAVSVSNLPGFSMVVKSIGAYLAITYIFRLVHSNVRVPGEAWFFLAWVLWASTGVLVAAIPSVVLALLETVFLIWVMIVIVAGLTESRKVLSFNMAMFLVAAVIVGGHSYLTGEFARAVAASQARTAVLADKTRIAGLALNANAFGILMLMTTVAIAYFWTIPHRSLNPAVKKTILLLTMLACAIAVVLSGSRKSLMGLVLFYLFWIWFCYRRLLIERISILLAVFAAFAVGGAVVIALARNTRIGVHMVQSWAGYTESGIAGGLGEGRAGMYEDAFKMALEHPLMGVGLGHFRLRSRSHLAAHSEYAEVLSTTGIIGMIIYFGWYVVLWRRTGKIRKYSTDLNDRNIAGLARAVLLTILIMNFSMWIFTQKVPWVILASFIGYTHVIWKRTVADQALAAEQSG